MNDKADYAIIYPLLAWRTRFDMKKKYYAVAKGRTPGIYLTWDDCKAQVEHFSGAVYKSFPTREEAQAFMEMAGVSAENASMDMGKQLTLEESADAKNKKTDIDATSTPEHLVAYVDGSYEHSRRTYAYGCVLVFEDEVVKLNGCGDSEELVTMRNVAGEILGSECAISWAVEHGYKEITIYYDYEGIEKWATGVWKAGKPGTIAYKAFIEEKKKDIIIHFEKVAAHTGVEYNEMADQLAKAALGI